MSGIYILKNVYNFAQILNLATTENLRKWDDSTLRKALSWAHYCEEVYKHVQQQGCGDDMNIKILQLSVLLTPASLLRLNFKSLKAATKLLTQIVLTNPHGSSDLQKILETCVDTTSWSEVNGQINARLILSNDLDEIFFIIWIQNPEACKHFKDRSVTTYAQILLTNLNDILKTSENQTKFQRYCECLCDRLVSVNRGWELMVHVFSIDPNDFSLEWKEQNQILWNIILSWMTCKTQDVVKCPILDVDLKLLKMASLHSAGFSAYYLLSLEKWSKCFQPCVDGTSNEIWRDTYGNGVSLLAEHFHYLLNGLPTRSTENTLKSNVLTVLSKNIESSDFTVWRTVANALLDHR